MSIELLKSKNIPLLQIEQNKGQIDGLPKNPRIIKDYKYEKLKKSIEDNPEMLGARELLVYPFDGKYIIIGGNMRYSVCKELGYKNLPCKILPESYSVEQLKAITIKDNVAFGENDWEMLANEWGTEELKEWGLDIPSYMLGDEDAINLDDFFEESNQEEKEEKFKIILEYTEDYYNTVIEAFKNHSGSKEDIVAKLLGL